MSSGSLDSLFFLIFLLCLIELLWDWGQSYRTMNMGSVSWVRQYYVLLLNFIPCFTGGHFRITVSLWDRDFPYSIPTLRRSYVYVSQYWSILILESHFEAPFSSATCGFNYYVWQNPNSKEMTYSTWDIWGAVRKGTHYSDVVRVLRRVTWDGSVLGASNSGELSQPMDLK